MRIDRKDLATTYTRARDLPFGFCLNFRLDGSLFEGCRVKNVWIFVRRVEDVICKNE